MKEASQSLSFDSYRLADGLLFNALLIIKDRKKDRNSLVSYYEEHDFSSASISAVLEWNKLRCTHFGLKFPGSLW